jgi:hypothetical protein
MRNDIEILWFKRRPKIEKRPNRNPRILLYIYYHKADAFQRCFRTRLREGLRKPGVTQIEWDK